MIVARDLLNYTKMKHVADFVIKHKIDIAVAKLEIATWSLYARKPPRTFKVLNKMVQVTDTTVTFCK
jgi:hypothetical protein